MTIDYHFPPFFSTLLTSCLTYHLGWVKKFNKMVLKGAGAKSSFQRDNKTNSNPRFSKTILISSDPNMLKSLIFVLSYFIRSGNFDQCSHSLENEQDVASTKRSNHDDHCNEKENRSSNVQSLVPLHSLLHRNSAVDGIITDGKNQNESVGQLDDSLNEKHLSSNRTSEKKVSFIVGAPVDSSSQNYERNMENPENKSISKNVNSTLDKPRHVFLCPFPKSLRLVKLSFICLSPLILLNSCFCVY